MYHVTLLISNSDVQRDGSEVFTPGLGIPTFVDTGN